MKHLVAGLFCAALSAAVSAQAPLSPEVERHIEAARVAAGTEHAGLFDAVCTTARNVIAQASAPPRQGGPGRGGGGRAGGPPTPPARETWHAEPVKVFDNLYFLGQTEFSVWAITTSQGIILLDAIFDYSVEDEVVGGLKKLGLDPANVKYVLISHGHGDHVGGALMMQEKYKSRIVMGDQDWTMVNSYVKSFPNGTPKRDIVAKDGDKITLGDTSVTLISTPGHTPDTYSFIFQVKDKGKPLTVAYNGGTAFNFVNDVPHFDIYIASQRKMGKAAADAGATVLLTNHSEFDNTVTKIRLMAARQEGEPSPFEAGANAVRRYFRVTEECAQAARLKLIMGIKSTVAIGSPQAE